jgi:deoxyribodipyrimidine photo-lyase
VIHPERVQYLNEEHPRRGRYVLYWMQQSQRAAANHALEFAVREADRLEMPLIVLFALTRRFPEAQIRHYVFMLEGLEETRAALARRGIKLVVRLSPPAEVVIELARSASVLVVDRGYLRIQRRWRDRVAARTPCRVVQVESDVVVPVETASDREEYAARTFRPKIRRHLGRFLVPIEETKPRRSSLDMDVASIDIADREDLLGRMRVARGAEPVADARGGASEAERLMTAFISHGLNAYPRDHADPSLGVSSGLSPYLHFGQISPLAVAIAVERARGVRRESKKAFLEQLIVRRELATNFCLYNAEYDSYRSIPEWARRTLGDHAGDGRPYTYTELDLERARTHDPHWNAAQMEMVVTGHMHNTMRMYWGKKIIEWTHDPREAYRIALRLNNKYELDGRDPNGFAGVAWCFGKHDRPWKERSVFGKVRSMTARGLERKYDIAAYQRRVEELAASVGFTEGRP